ncbi:hypothetical protein [Treponema porcinum]|uniref:hypothetical protein n=1 Tax=Treponema porcinum TaxID=261392 RepID=UPI002A8199B7|nr:hypothetical protein [Treponema porcinum]MDY4468805.1 hypothetical protein [Treponema porcinum]
MKQNCGYAVEEVSKHSSQALCSVIDQILEKWLTKSNKSTSLPAFSLSFETTFSFISKFTSKPSFTSIESRADHVL